MEKSAQIIYSAAILTHSKGKQPEVEQSPADCLRAIATKRDTVALQQLFSFYAPRLKTWLLAGGTTEETAEDVIQETMVIIWHKAAQYNPAKASPATWVYTIARHVRLTRHHRMKVPVLLPTMLEEAEEASAPEDVIFVRKALKELPDEQSQLLYDTYFLGLTQTEIADKRHLPLGTVKSRMRLGMEKIRQMTGILTLWLWTL